MSLQYHNLGCSDLYVSEVCLGTMTFGEQTPQDEAHKILSHARELGVNYFDTSELYPVAPKRDTQGQSSECLGNWLQAGGQKREEVVIASKVVGNTKDTKSVGVQGSEMLNQNKDESRVQHKICPVLYLNALWLNFVFCLITVCGIL